MFQPTYTVSDLDAQLKHARDMMRASGMPDLRLTRTCDDDTALRRQIEKHDPFQWPIEFGRKIGENRTYNFRANLINLLLKVNGY